MSEFLGLILSSASSNSESLFFILFLAVFWMLRSDAKEHKKEYQATVREMFNVVNKNTESNARLCSSIDGLKEKIDDTAKRTS